MTPDNSHAQQAQAPTSKGGADFASALIRLPTGTRTCENLKVSMRTCENLKVSMIKRWTVFIA